MTVVALVVSAPFLAILATRPVLRRLALRNAIRRPRETLLVIAGSMLATALMTAAFVVGDTFEGSLRANAVTQLGPIDEVVSVPLAQAASLDRLAALRDPAVDGVLRVVTSGASAAVVGANGAATSAAPKVQLLEVDFAAAARFGSAGGASGLAGPGPGAGEAVVTRPLADRLRIGPGASLRAFALGRSVALRVARVVPQEGVAGYWNGREFVSYNAFVAPGTIARLAAGATSAAAPPRASVLVSNVGGIEAGAARTDEVVRRVRAVLGTRILPVETVKRDLLDQAARAGKSLTQLYQALGFFAVAAGVLLLVNIFRMLAEERRSELGMLRAMGLRRRALVGAFASEGWLYAAVASAVGVLVGLGVARLVIVGAARIFSGSADADLRLPIRFAFTSQSLRAGFVLGLVIAVLTIVGTSIGISRFNVIAAIRDLDAEPRAPHRWTRIAWAVLAAAGLALTAAGLGAGSAVLMMVAGSLAALGVRFWLRGRVHDRPLVTLCSAAALAWGVAAVPIAVARGGDLQIQAFVVQGVAIVVAAVALVTEYQGELGALLARLTRRRLSVRLGLAYPLARRSRTALTLGQFAIVVFVLVYISVLTAMFGSQIDQFTADVGGGANVFVESNRANPVPFAELSRTAGARAVAPLASAVADVTPPAATTPTKWPMAGFDSRLVDLGPPELADRGRFASDEAAYRYVLANPGTAMVDQFFLAEDEGPEQAGVGIGDTIVVTDPLTGRSARLRVVAKSQDDWLGNGGLTSAATLRSIFGRAAVPSRAYVRAASPASFARAVEARYFPQGAKADPIRALLDQQLSRQQQFFTLMRAFLAVGLVIGVAGIGVIMVRAVHERRRQVGVLRSLGFPAAHVSNAFAVEALFVAFEGVLVGIALGFVSTWSITLSNSFGEGLSFRVPVVAVLVLVAGTLVGALVATLGPARSASRIKPAVALRIAD